MADVGADFFYTAYGLGVRSALPLPSLSPREGDGPCDVVIRFGALRASASSLLERCIPSTVRPNLRRYHEKGRAYLVYEEGITVLIESGRVAVVEAAPDVREDVQEDVLEAVLQFYILTDVLPILLHQRGLFLLHGSAVGIGGGGVLFLGGSGWGKSTLVAALYRRGHVLITDDVAALTWNGSDRTNILPAFPRLKLWPEALIALGERPDPLPKLHPEIEKRTQAVDRFASEGLPVTQIYVLAEGDETAITPLMGQEAFIALTTHSFMLRILAETEGTVAHFRQCEAVAARTPLFRLTRPRTFAALPDVAQRIEAQVAVHSSSHAA